MKFILRTGWWRFFLGLGAALVFFPDAGIAVDRFVNVNNPNPSAPYTNWATAATVIQDAVDASTNGDVVWVTNGVYAAGSVASPYAYYAPTRVSITKPISVVSMNGPAVTTISARGNPSSSFGRRVAYLTNGAFLSGFTLTAGETDLGDTSSDNQNGAGVNCQSVNCVVSNCVITGNVAGRYGGGGYNGTYIRCLIAGNSAVDIQGGRIGYGGGVGYGNLLECTIASNSARYEGGGVLGGALTNCLMRNNSAVWGGGSANANLVNCTVVTNSAYDDGGLGGGGGGGVVGGTIINSIVVQNSGPYGAYNFWSPNFSYSCTFPDPGGTSNIITLDPLFVDVAGGNFHLQTNSPCLNAGTNGVVFDGTDLDGAPRVVDDAVDMGAYELQHAPFILTGPVSQSVVVTSNFTFGVSAIGNAPQFYQWLFNGAPLSDGGRVVGANSNLLSVAAAQTNDAGNYGVVVSNSTGAVTSSVATLNVLMPITLVTDLTNKTTVAGSNTTFTISATGISPLSYLWYIDGAPWIFGGRSSGSNTPTAKISPTLTNDNGFSVFVVLTNTYGALTSSVAHLTVVEAAQILSQPVSQSVVVGGNATFSVVTAGTAPAYGWYFNGTLLSDNGHISGSTTPVLTISNVQPADVGGLVAVVMNSVNAATSRVASLTPLMSAMSSVRYVNLSNATPATPFLSWDTAATNIQDAMDASVAGDLVLVTNGAYGTGGRAVANSTNRVVVDKAVTLQSVNGAAVTSIVGGAAVGTRCVYLTNGAVLAGFTLTNGSGTVSDKTNLQMFHGGGVWCESGSVVISNCVFVNNTAAQFGGAAFRGQLFNCLFTNNVASQGGAVCSNTLWNCTLIKNSARFQNITSGGGAVYSTLSNCVLVANTCNGGGGGAAFSTLISCVLSNNSGGSGGAICVGMANGCLIVSNQASTGGGAYSNILNNCIVRNNRASARGGGAYGSVLANCTVFSNSVSATTAPGGGIYGGSASNSIVYYNVCPLENNFDGTMPMYYCCVPMMPTNGFGNVTNPPVFVDLVNEDLHLQPNSPCINAGNNFFAPVGWDFDGHPRISGGTVDMGAYEFQSPASVLSYVWAQKYGLPTDGSADNLDSDGDGFSNWQESIAGTDPTDAQSRLAMLPAPVTNSVSGVTVSWASAPGVLYYLQRGTNLSAQPPFVTVQSHIIGQAGMTSYTDTNAMGQGAFMYRVGVEH